MARGRCAVDCGDRWPSPRRPSAGPRKPLGSGGAPGGSSAEGAHWTILGTLSVDRGLWIAAKTEAKRLQVAHTPPVYVTVGGGSFHNPDTAPDDLDRSEQDLDEIEEAISKRGDQPGHQACRYREGLMKRIRETRQVIDSLRAVFE